MTPADIPIQNPDTVSSEAIKAPVPVRDAPSLTPSSPEIELVRLLARIAAERDYEAFIAGSATISVRTKDGLQ